MSYLKYDGSNAVETGAPVSNFYGTAGAETDNGTAASEGFYGNGGDVLIGGAGDDTYYLQSDGNRIVEQAGGGVDKVVSWANVSIANQPNIENLEVDGNGVYGAGNSGDNIIYAGTGQVQLYGGGGQDVFVAGTGQDTFIVQKGTGNDVVYGFKTSEDVVRLSAGFTNFSQVQQAMTQVGADVKIDFGGGQGMILRNTQVGQLTAANFELQLDSSKLGGMTFHDEFNGSSASIWDPTYNPTGTWRPDFGYQGPQGAGSYTLTGNNESEIYTSPYFRGAAGTYASPFSEGGGNLTITAQNAPAGASDLFGYNYTSGMISTKESFAQTYGYFEMRAELPTGAGGWPAFWLVPADGSWPPELDVMETLSGDPNNDHTTAHSGTANTQSALASYIPNTTDGYHTYGVLWTKTDLVWYVDGVEVYHTATPADMNKPMYMIANLALGGWSGSVDNSSIPMHMNIDYIRSYALADGSTTDQGFDANNGGNAAFSTTTSAPADGTGAVTSPPPVSPPPASPPPASPPPASPATTTAAGQLLQAQDGGATLTGGSGADTLVGAHGPDVMTGGAGADHFVFNEVPWQPATVTDFQVGVDKIDVSALLTQAGYTGSDPVGDGYIKFFTDSNGGSLLYFDATPATNPWGSNLGDIQGVAPTQLGDSDLVTAAVASPPPVSPPPVSPPPVATTPVSPPPVSPPPVSPPPASPPPAAGLTLQAADGGAHLVGGAGADTLIGAHGPDTLTGGAGADHFVFTEVPWQPATITDFQVGTDQFDVTALLHQAGYTGHDPVADGYIKFFTDSNGGTLLYFDATPATNPWGSNLGDVQGVAPSQLSDASLVGFGGTASPPAASPPPPPASPPPPPAGVTLHAHDGGSKLVGGAGADTLIGAHGPDVMTGGAGADHFVFNEVPWQPATITDFQVGVDQIDVTALLKQAGYKGHDPVGDSYVKFFTDTHGGSLVYFDATPKTNPWGSNLGDIQNVAPSHLSDASLVGNWIVH